MATPVIRNQEVIKTLAEKGFAVLPQVLGSAETATLVSSLQQADAQTSIRSRGGVYAIRNLLDVVPEIRSLATSPQIGALVQAVLGPQAIAVRGLLFDKTPEANWKVPWHQDLTIAVKTKMEVPGFGPWSTKAGVLHVQPPASILENMLAVRIHLDDCGDANGAVRVIPGSHLHGRLSTLQVVQISTAPAVSCAAAAGGVLLMRPLLLHASSACPTPRHRRVIHLEFAASALPAGLEWYERY